MSRLTPPRLLSAAERAAVIRRIRTELSGDVGGPVSLKRFGALVATALGVEKPFSASVVQGWERGAEPAFLTGCAIAHLGGLPAEALAFKQSGGASRPASEEYGPPPTAPLRKVAERGGFPTLKGRPITPAPAKRRGKRA